MGGKRFGGFTGESWDQSNEYKKDAKSFLFSLDKKEIYYVKDESHAIYCNKEFGPSFGIGDLKLNINYCYDGSGNSYETSGKKSILAETSNFNIKNYKVYKINLE